MKKKNVLYLLLLICSFGLFSACDKNDDEPALPVEQELAGTYKGLLGITVNDASVGGDVVQKIYISKSSQGDNLLKLELKDFSFGSLKLGDITVDACPVTKTGETYAFSGENTLKLNAPIGTCPVKVTGTIEGSKISINIGVTVEALNQDVTAKFAGTKLTGNESKEAKIFTYTFESELVMEQPVIDENKGEITFKVIDTATEDALKALVPVLTISEKATISPASGVAQDFSGEKKVVYTVIAEDGTVKEYKVFIAGKQTVLKYSFEEWKKDGFDKPQPIDQLATSSEGAAFIASLIGGTPTIKTEDKKEGNYAIGLVTRSYPEPNTLIPAIISGSVFTGKFDLDFMDWATGEKLSCTRFGIAYDKKPVRFKGWYKYAPGAKLVNGSDPDNIFEVPEKTDECAIQAVLYKVENDDDVLTGHDINKSDKRVAIAALEDGTAKEQYTEFDLPFTYLEGKAYEVGAKYKIAIVCSSSKEGDFFIGAEGSTLILDELEIIGE